MRTLMEIFEFESRKIMRAFEEASIKYKTPDDVATYREQAFRDFLEQYLPLSYRVGKGEIIDKNPGPQSAQVDCIICTPYHPYTFRKSERGLFFAEGVGAVIEVKPDITDLRELRRGINQIRSVKKLERSIVEDSMMMVGDEYERTKWRKIPCMLFSNKSSQLNTLKNNIQSYFSDNSIPLGEQPDAVVILEKGIIYNIKDSRDPLKIIVNGERKLGLVGCEYGIHTLLQFLLHLSKEMPAEVHFKSILNNYSLEGLSFNVI